MLARARSGESAVSIYEEVVSRIERVRDLPARQESFENFAKAFRELKVTFPERGRGIILIAGTNGKGSVAKTLETLLLAVDPAVGIYTSPHMMRTTERIRSWGKDLTDEEFVEAFRLVESIVTQFCLSHFETLTLMMTEVFFGGRVRKPVKRAVIEVGVGGKWDPTKLLPHEASVITALGLDHRDILGGDLASIAEHKLGIVESGNQVIHFPFPTEVAAKVKARQKEVEATWHEVRSASFRVEKFQGAPSWFMETPWGVARLALSGKRAVENTSLALRTLDVLGYDVAQLISHLKNVRWPCRMEGFLLQNKRVYLSGDHNPQGVESLRELLKEYDYDRLLLVVGVGKNKDVDAMLGDFASFSNAELYLTLTPFRSGSIAHLEKWKDRAASVEPDAAVALQKALAAAALKDLVVVSGSLYLAGEIRRRIFNGDFGKVEVL
jgi:dihydrofolate synthase/folylpolyglutamate synthase